MTISCAELESGRRGGLGLTVGKDGGEDSCGKEGRLCSFSTSQLTSQLTSQRLPMPFPCSDPDVGGLLQHLRACRNAGETIARIDMASEGRHFDRLGRGAAALWAGRAISAEDSGWGIL